MMGTLDVDLANLSINSGSYYINTQMLAINKRIEALNEDKVNLQEALIAAIVELTGVTKEILQILREANDRDA